MFDAPEWTDSNRRELRQFLDSPTGESLLRRLRFKELPVPKSNEDKEALQQAYKLAGWIHCLERIVALAAAPAPTPVTNAYGTRDTSRH